MSQGLKIFTGANLETVDCLNPMRRKFGDLQNLPQDLRSFGRFCGPQTVFAWDLDNIGTLNYWFWAQSILTLLKLDISDLQNDWHLQLLILGIIGISCFWFLELFIFSMSDIKHDWCMTWLSLAYLILGISGIEHYQQLGVAVNIY